MGEDGLYPGNLFHGAQTGHPLDPNAWFNALPREMGERTLAQYWVDPGTTDFGINSGTLPFPAGKGRIWHCPTARMSASDGVVNGGRYGFFSYAMNIDLKKQTASDNYDYPQMPRLGALAKPGATVLMLEAAFNPRTEPVNGSPQYNSVNPAARWRSFARRHREGGHIVFVDSHVAFFATARVQNGAGDHEPLDAEIIWNPPYRQTHP